MSKEDSKAVALVKAKLHELYGGYDADTIEEFLAWEAKEVWRSSYDEHRWYQAYDKVVKIDDTFIMFRYATNTGDNSLEDAGFTFTLDSLKIVEQKERKEFYYE